MKEARAPSTTLSLFCESHENSLNARDLEDIPWVPAISKNRSLSVHGAHTIPCIRRCARHLAFSLDKRATEGCRWIW